MCACVNGGHLVRGAATLRLPWNTSYVPSGCKVIFMIVMFFFIATSCSLLKTSLWCL